MNAITGDLFAQPVRRIRDFLREREIERLAHGCREASEAGDKAKARHFYHAMRRAMSERSPEQMQRILRREGWL
jgi:hypothetical protein